MLQAPIRKLFDLNTWIADNVQATMLLFECVERYQKEETWQVSLRIPR